MPQMEEQKNAAQKNAANATSRKMPQMEERHEWLRALVALLNAAKEESIT
jgi:hypothetical protein